MSIIRIKKSEVPKRRNERRVYMENLPEVHLPSKKRNYSTPHIMRTNREVKYTY